MSYETFRVEITRDETVATGGVSIEITAYLDRVPEHNDYSREILTRVPKGVWNSRLQFAGGYLYVGVSSVWTLWKMHMDAQEELAEAAEIAGL